MSNEYKDGWAAGYDVGFSAAPAVQKAIQAEQAEPTPEDIDPETLSEDERAFYDAGYYHGYNDCCEDNELEYDDDVSPVSPGTRMDTQDYEEYLEDMRTNADA
jgi:hypothetical protein